MLQEVAAELDHNGQHLVIAHDLGQVADLLTRTPDTTIRVVGTIDDALRTLDHS